MTRTAQRPADKSIVAGYGFARVSPEGRVDGGLERGIYAHDLRVLKRVEMYRAERELAVPGEIAVDEHGCAVRFRLERVEPGTGVLLVVELDGTDLFVVRDVLLDPPEGLDGPGNGLGLGDVRPDARVRLSVDCDGAELVDRDGVARSEVPIKVDGTPRTASWRWTVDPDEAAPVDVFVELRAEWALSSDEQPAAPREFDAIRETGRGLREDWLAGGRPTIAGSDELARVHERSLEDLASLRLRVDDGIVLAGGVPWFLTVFGRDSLLSAWMALPVDPELAVATLRHLARHQATEYDLATDAEPGKIQHEERTGVAARRWHERYFGSVDSTPLFVMLLAEHARWSGSVDLARELEQPARAAIGWILSRIEEDEFGLLSYWRRSERGLDVQSWKDSADSQRDNTGKVATGLIRPLEAQAYAVAALRGAARLASHAWDDDVIGSEWSAAARVLERRLLDHMRVELPPARLAGPEDPRSGGYLAQALDSAGNPVDSLCSNIGHVLWCEAITDPGLRARSVEQLAGDSLDSGWGIRTMSTNDAGYAADSYHCGSVWPHDTAICVTGIAHYDREVAARVARSLLDAAVAMGGRLPEVIDGSARVPGEAPRILESACSPQAWAAAAPLLVLRAVLGLEPDANGNELVAHSSPAPAWLHGFQWLGVHALGARWDVEVGRDGIVDVIRRAG